ncbi:MAG: hypothetical protein HY764_01945 [Candidatus Portnoybacteria bacterium]|nr:hypothetical protein [Candidatus Portnoybacteria bacterium]
MKKTIVILIISIVAVGLTIGLWTYTRAAGDTISVCVKKSGLVYVIGEGFRRDDCKKNDKLLTWNIQGLKGDKILASKAFKAKKDYQELSEQIISHL